MNRSATAGTLLLAVLACATAVSPAVARARLALRHVTLDLPGSPSKVIPSDLDGDGLTDLVVVVAYTEIQSIGGDRIENLVHVSTVIPAVFDHREARAYLATQGGGYRSAGAPLELPQKMLHMEPARGTGVIALTDDGIARLRYSPSGDGPALRLEPLVEDAPILARTRTFYASLELVADLNGDEIDDVLLPGPDSLAIYLGNGEGLTTPAASRVEIPGREQRLDDEVRRSYPMPAVRDVDGDRIADLIFSGSFARQSPGEHHVLLGSAEGVFRPIRSDPLDCHDRLTDLRISVADPSAYPWPEGLVALRDLDGNGRAEAVFVDERSRGDSFRKEMKDAKKPISEYRFHRLNDDLSIVAEPYFRTEVIGHTMGERGAQEDEEEFAFHIEQFQDLDGDGREDLVTVTLDFSLFQAIKILATKRIGIGLDFHVYAQDGDGAFHEVPNLDLSEKLKLDLNDLKVGRFGQFAGDFDGDGRQDFAHLGRGRDVTLHGGRPGCDYPRDADLSIRLDEEPASLDLVRIEDLDGDGRADIRITRPLPTEDPDTTAAARLDLYLTGDAP